MSDCHLSNCFNFNTVLFYNTSLKWFMIYHDISNLYLGDRTEKNNARGRVFREEIFDPSLHDMLQFVCINPNDI